MREPRARDGRQHARKFKRKGQEMRPPHASAARVWIHAVTPALLGGTFARAPSVCLTSRILSPDSAVMILGFTLGPLGSSLAGTPPATSILRNTCARQASVRPVQHAGVSLKTLQGGRGRAREMLVGGTYIEGLIAADDVDAPYAHAAGGPTAVGGLHPAPATRLAI